MEPDVPRLSRSGFEIRGSCPQFLLQKVYVLGSSRDRVGE